MLNNDQTNPGGSSSLPPGEEHKQDAPEDSSASKPVLEAENGKGIEEPQTEKEAQAEENSDTQPNDIITEIYDSTHVHEIHMAADGDKGDQLGNTDLYREVEDFFQLDTDNIDKSAAQLELKKGMELVGKFEIARNKAGCTTDAIHTKYFIMQGKLWIQIKALVKASGDAWEIWVEKNLKNFSMRSVADYMRLAEISDILEFVVLGKQRLVWLAGAIKENQDKTIRSFLDQHKIDFKPEEDNEQEIEDARVDIETVLMMKRLQSNKIKGADEEKIRGLVKSNVHKNKDFLKDIKIATASGSDVNIYLDELIANDGKASDETVKKRGPDHFADLAKKLQKVIKSLSGNEELLAKMDTDTLNALLKALRELKKERNS